MAIRQELLKDYKSPEDLLGQWYILGIQAHAFKLSILLSQLERDTVDGGGRCLSKLIDQIIWNVSGWRILMPFWLYSVFSHKGFYGLANFLLFKVLVGKPCFIPYGFLPSPN